MNILLTGGLGTIGSYLSAKLFLDGHNITIIDNMEIGHTDNLKFYLNEEQINKIIIVKKDILDLDILKHSIYKADLVYHLAATLGTLNVIEQPLRMLRVNSSGTHNIVDYCVLDQKPLVIMSSYIQYVYLIVFSNVV